jgi:hypothetical protein
LWCCILHLSGLLLGSTGGIMRIKQGTLIRKFLSQFGDYWCISTVLHALNQWQLLCSRYIPTLRNADFSHLSYFMHCVGQPNVQYLDYATLRFESNIILCSIKTCFWGYSRIRCWGRHLGLRRTR